MSGSSKFGRIGSCATLAVVAASLIAACDLFPNAPADEELLEGFLDGLSPAQVNLHIAGDEEFATTHGPAEGAAPIFVATSCASCHPGDGKGHPVFNLTRFGRMAGGSFDPLRTSGGPQLQHRAVAGYPPEVIPPEATGITQLTAPVVVGVGFLEAVDDATLLVMEDPDDRDGDGISGRVQWIDSTDFIAEIVSIDALVSGEDENRTRLRSVDGKFIGRFGKKGVAINLVHQTVQAYIEDMGLTTDLVTRDQFNVQVGGLSTDDVADPEIASDVVDQVVFYLRTLRAPPRRNEDDPDVLAGENLFEQIGCASCHVPTLTTGRSEIAALNEQTFHPYSDLLLHDMGPELDDGYTEGIALTSEWRTPPLWGIGLAHTAQGGDMFLLHDGRAQSIEESIEYHGGEGAASRAVFGRLSDVERAQVIEFVMSL